MGRDGSGATKMPNLAMLISSRDRAAQALSVEGRSAQKDAEFGAQHPLEKSATTATDPQSASPSSVSCKDTEISLELPEVSACDQDDPVGLGEPHKML